MRQSTSAQRQLAIVGRVFVREVPEWRSGDEARVRGVGAEGIVRSVVDGSAWVEIQHGSAEYNAFIKLERMDKIDPSVAAARNALRANAGEFGGSVVVAECRACYAPAWGHVVTDPGEPETSNGPGVPAQMYVAGYVRSCNCDVQKSDIERDLIVAAATENE